jgi:hypothetical protein
VEFVDSVFNDPPNHTHALLEEIIRRPWKADFTAMGVHPRNLNRELLDLMWRAGFRSFMITPESASDKMLRSYRKGFNRDDVIRAAEDLAHTSFSVWWSFLLGGPGETQDTLKETLDFCLRYLHSQGGGPRQVAQLFFGVRLYPHTELWNIAVQEGIITSYADPLKSLWYVSRELNVKSALNQVESAAAECSEILIGYDESYLSFSGIAAALCKLLGKRPPYWRHVQYLNALALKLGFRFATRPKNLALRITDIIGRQQTEQQDCSNYLINQK